MPLGETELESEYEGELEFEDELEGEEEGEDFDLGGVLSGLLGEGESEDELEGEDFDLGGVLTGLLGEGEFEDESEEFFGGIARFVRKNAPLLRQVARVAAPMVGTALGGPLGGALGNMAARALGEGEYELEGEFEDELESELEGEEEGEEFDLGGIVRGLLGEGEGEYEDESEYEYEDESELEGEWEGEFEDESEAMANPLRRVYPDAMMEHLGHAAAEAETEAEAEAFIGALVPLAAGLARSAAPRIARSTPHLVRGLSTVGRTLRRNPSTRPLVRALPTIASRTTRSLARQVAHGHPITPRRAVRTLARQTADVLRSPRTRHRVVHRNRALDRRYHHATRTGQWWTGGVPASSAAAVRALAPRPASAGTLAPARYRPRAGYRAPVRYGTPVSGGTAVRRVPGQPARGRGRPRSQRLPAGLSIAWVPVPAWRGSQPPPGAYRY